MLSSSVGNPIHVHIIKYFTGEKLKLAAFIHLLAYNENVCKPLYRSTFCEYYDVKDEHFLKLSSRKANLKKIEFTILVNIALKT